MSGPSVTVVATGGFSGSVTLSISGLPSGVTAVFSPNAITQTGTATLTLSASSTASLAASQSITVQATSGSITHSAVFVLTVIGPQGFTLAAPVSLSLYPTVQATLPVTITGQNGFNGSVTLSLSGLPKGITAATPTLTGYVGTTVNFTLTAVAGTTFSGPVILTGTSGMLASTAQTTVTVVTTPDFALVLPYSTYIYNGSTSSQNLQVTAYNGFSASVSVTFGTLPGGLTISPSSLTLTPGTPANVTVSVPFAASGQLAVPVQATSGTLSHSLTWTINVLSNQLIVTAPASVSVHAGSSANISVSAQTYAGSSTLGTLTLSVSGVSSGLTVTPTQATFSAQGAQTFYVEAASGAQSGAVTFQGTWNSLTGNAQTAVNVLPASTNVPTTVRSRNAYVRSDSTAQYLSYPPPNWSLYNPATGRFFATDYGTSRVNVYDPSTEKQIASISVPGAFGIGQVTGGGTLYVGTLSGDIYVVDPASMSVSKRLPSSSIGTSGFSANAVFPRPDGTLLLESYFLVPEYSWVDGYNKFALWNPATNALSNLSGCNNGPITNITFGFPTNNGARLLTVPQILSPATNLLCSEDLTTGAIVRLAAPSGTSTGGYLTSLALSPDGNTVAGFDGTNIWVLDAATLTVKNKFAASSSSALAANPSLLIGSDNQTVYLTGSDSGEHVLVYNMSNGQLTGWLPSVQIAQQDGYTPSVPILQGLSANGLVGGVMDQGFGFLDVNATNPSPVGTALGTASLKATYGPASGGTPTSWVLANQGTTTTSPSLGSAYFGPNAATGFSLSTSGFAATTPAGSAGPVDVITVTTDGGEQLLPEGFSYGPSILEAPTSYATAEGGGPAQLYGYGFGLSYVPNLTTQIVTPPSDLQVLAGGASATVTGYLPGPYSALDYFNLPFPLEGAEYTVPAGVAGTSVSLNVTNSAGTATATQKLTYLPATVAYPLSGASLMDGVYDATRDVYYFTDTAQVRIFSRTLGKWLTPISVPLPAIPYGPERLHGIALSHDNSKLVVSDSGAMAIDLIDLVNGNKIQTFGLALTNPAPQYLDTITPAGVAVTNAGKMFFDTYDQDGDGAAFLYTLDPGTGMYSDIGGTQAIYGQVGYPQNEGNYPYARLVMSSDGQTIYFANEGQIGAVNTATGIGTTYCSACTDLTDGGFDIVLGSDGSTLFADGALLNTQLQLRALQSLNWRELFDADYIYGAALSADNKLLFQPGTQFIDVFDTRSGGFVERISLPQPLNGSYRALVGDGKDNILVAITGSQGNSVSVLDLTSLPAAAPLPYVVEPLPGSSSFDTTARNPSRARVASPLALHYHRGLVPPLTIPDVPQNAAPDALSHLPENYREKIPK